MLTRQLKMQHRQETILEMVKESLCSPFLLLKLMAMQHNRGADPRARRMEAGLPAAIRRAQSGQGT